MFEVFEPTKLKVVQNHVSEGKQRVPGARSSSVSKLMAWEDDDGLMTLSLLDEGEQPRSVIKPSSTTIDIGISALTRFNISLFSGATVEANFDLMPLLSTAYQSKNEHTGGLWVLDTSLQLAGSRIDERDLMWASGPLDDLKQRLTHWQDSLYDSIDRFIGNELDDFYVLGTSVSDAGAEGMFAPTCLFFRSAASAQPRALLMNCSQVAVRHLIALGATCYRLLEGDAGVISLATSTKGRFQHLRGSNHIVVEGELSISIVAHFIAEEVFAFISKGHACRFVPSLLSSSPFLHAMKADLQWTAVQCKSTNLVQKVRASSILSLPLLQGVVRKVMSCRTAQPAAPRLVGYKSLRDGAGKPANAASAQAGSAHMDVASQTATPEMSFVNPMVIVTATSRKPPSLPAPALPIADDVPVGKYFIIRLAALSPRTSSILPVASYLPFLEAMPADDSSGTYHSIKDIQWSASKPTVLSLSVDVKPLPQVLPVDTLAEAEVAKNQAMGTNLVAKPYSAFVDCNRH